MNFNYNNYNFNLGQVKVGQRKSEEETKGKEVKGEELPSPKSAPETVVLTGSASEIQAAIAKATVQGAMGTTSTQQVDGGDRGLIAELAEYRQMRDEYLSQLENLTPFARVQCLVDMQAKIEDIVNYYLVGVTQNQGMVTEIAQELFNDYNNWANDVKEIKSQPDYLQVATPADDMEALFVWLEEDHRELNPSFVFNMMDGDRISYFRDKIREYQYVIGHMNYVMQNYSPDPNNGTTYLQKFNQYMLEIQQRLADARRYLQLSIDAAGLVSISDIEESTANIGQNQSVK